MQTGYSCPYCGFTNHTGNANYCGKCGNSIRFSHNSLYKYGKYVNSIFDERDLSTIPSPFVGTEDYIPIEFVVMKSIVYNNISNRNKEMSDKLEKIKDLINKELKNNKLFGGNSKSEVLKAISSIID